MEQQVEEIEQEPKPKKLRRQFSSLYVSFELAGKAVELLKMLCAEVLKEFCDELPFEVYMDKLVIRTMDVARYKMIDFVLPKYMFEEWLVTGDKEQMAELPVRFTVPLDEVKYAIEDAGKDAKVRFNIQLVFATTKPIREREVRKPSACPKCMKPTNWNHLELSKRNKKVYKRGKGYRENYKCECGKRFKLSVYTKKERITETTICNDRSRFLIIVKEKTADNYTIQPIEIADEEIPMPKISFDVTVKVLARDFRKKMEKLEKRTTHVELASNSEKLLLNGEGDLTKVSMNIDRGSDILLDMDCYKEQKACYNLRHLLTLLPKKLIDVISLEYSTDMPLRVTWQTNLNDSTLRFYLAPRVDVDF